MGNGYRSWCDYCDNGYSECEPQWQSAVDRIRLQGAKTMGAVNKQTCESALNNEIRIAYERLESVINASLMAGTRRFEVSSIPSKNRQSIIEMIINQYRGAGWQVKRVTGSDCRDYRDSWDYLQFS